MNDYEQSMKSLLKQVFSVPILRGRVLIRSPHGFPIRDDVDTWDDVMGKPSDEGMIFDGDDLG